MLAKRIIACLDVRDGQVVKGINFESLRSAGDPATLARRYNEEGIDELVILDVTATLEKRLAMAATVRAVARELFIPLCVGGGIRDSDDAAAVVDAGADKVSLNTAALANPDLISRLAGQYGSQAVIIAIDAKREGDRYGVYVRSGTTASGRDAVEWAKEAESRGAGEILLTSIDRDGTKSWLRLRDDRRRFSGRQHSRHRVRRCRLVRRLRGRVHRGSRRRCAGCVDLPLLRARRGGPEGTPA
jgi:cyclase